MMNPINQQQMEQTQRVHLSGLPVRTDLRAGSALDDLNNQAKELWNKLTNAVSNATSAVTGGTTNTTPKASA